MSNNFNTDNLLILSIAQDLKFLDDIIGEIILEEECKNIKSWMFPHKNYSELVDKYKNYGSKEIFYSNYLEMVIDKVYFLINFVNMKMESSRKIQNICNPSRVSFGRSCQQLWRLISEKNQDSPIEKEETDDVESHKLMNKSSQTEIKSSHKCDSCFIANDFLIELSEELSNYHQIYSDTKTVRESLNDDIFNLTKVGVTMKLCNALKQDYQRLMRNLNEKENENEELIEKEFKLQEIISCLNEKDDDIVELKQIISQQKKENEDLSKSIKNLNDEFEEYKLKSSSTIEQMAEKNKDEVKRIHEKFDSTKSKMADQIENLQKKRDELESTIEKSKKYIDELKGTIRSSKASNVSFEIDYKTLIKKYEWLFGDYSKICEENFKVQTDLKMIKPSMDNAAEITDNLTGCIERISMEIEGLKNKIVVLKDREKQSEEYCKVFHEKIREFRQNYSVKKNIKEKMNTGVKGDPLADLGQQVEHNEEIIEKLTKQNEKFRRLMRVYKRKDVLKM